jgi:hypothetical protein
MKKIFFIVVIVILIILGVVIIEKNIIFQEKYMEKNIILNEGQSDTFENITITNIGGGHKILVKGGDMSYADIELKINDKIKSIMMKDNDQLLWNGYLIAITETGWNGDYIKLFVKKVGEPKITNIQAYKIARETIESVLKLSQEETDKLETRLAEKGEYFEISFYKTEQKTPLIMVKIDRFSGKATIDK